MVVQLPSKGSISDADIDELSRLLEMRAVPFKGMSLEMLDGFLSALAVGPEMVPPSEWTALVWGPRPPRWESEEEAGRVHGLLMELWNDIVRRVGVDPEHAREREMPLIAMPEDDDDETESESWGVEWASGFLDGVDLREKAWDASAVAEQWVDETLLEIQALADGERQDLDANDPPKPLPVSERLEIIAGIQPMLYDLNQVRLESLVAREPIRKQAAPGRNDPCPCGSGKKFKKCCGATPTLH
jgi:uncharacterized protein